MIYHLLIIVKEKNHREDYGTSPCPRTKKLETCDILHTYISDITRDRVGLKQKKPVFQHWKLYMPVMLESQMYLLRNGL